MKKSMLLATLLAFSSASNALTIDCSGKVTVLSLQAPGGLITLSLLGGPSYIYLCNVEQTYNGISATTCKQMYQTLMLAKITGASMGFRFDNQTTCAAIPQWQAVPLNGWNTVLD
jgi:hypothetical protein